MSTGSPTEHQPTAPGDSLGSGQIANAPANEPGPSAPGEREKRQHDNGLRFLLVGGILAAIGIALMTFLGNGNQDGIGATLAIVACLPTVVGLVLLGSAWVSRRSRQDKPFA